MLKSNARKRRMDICEFPSGLVQIEEWGTRERRNFMFEKKVSNDRL